MPRFSETLKERIEHNRRHQLPECRGGDYERLLLLLLLSYQPLLHAVDRNKCSKRTSCKGLSITRKSRRALYVLHFTNAVFKHHTKKLHDPGHDHPRNEWWWFDIGMSDAIGKRLWQKSNWLGHLCHTNKICFVEIDRSCAFVWKVFGRVMKRSLFPPVHSLLARLYPQLVAPLYIIPM